MGLASAGTDTINQIKQAKEFGITMQLAGLLVFISDVHGLGLETAQGLTITNSFYWDFDDRTRAFSTRLQSKAPGKRAGMVQAGTYAGSLHYLKVAQAMGAAEAKKDGVATVARMKATPTDDDCFGKGTIRAGRDRPASRLSLAGEEAVREQGAVGLSEAPGDDARRIRHSVH